MNIALVKLSSLGDVVHALPVATALRAHLPGARVTWIVERREAALLRDHPALDEVLPINTRRWRRARSPRGVVEVGRVVWRVRRWLWTARFDVTIDLQGLIKSGLLTAATGARVRIGFSARHCREPLSAVFTNRRVVPPPGARHVVDQYLALLKPLGLETPAAEFCLPSDSNAESQIDEFFRQSGLKPRDRVVVLNPGAGRPDKRWPERHFHDLAGRLVNEMGASVLVVWGPRERGRARAIVEEVGATLAPPTTLDELIAVLRRASVVVAGDTGPLHLAAALGTPCVGLYGPTSPERNGPYGKGHRALSAPDGRMASLPVDTVFRAVADVLG